MVVPSSVSWEDVEQGAKEVMKHEIWKTQTWKEFKTTIAAAIHVPVQELTQHKVALQALIAQGGEEGANGNEDDHPEEGVDDEDGDEDDRNECGSSSSDDSDQGDAMPAMRDLARAMNLGPRPLRGLKQMKRRDAERTLRERLISSGAQFKGLFPSSREVWQKVTHDANPHHHHSHTFVTRQIAQARRRTATKNDLDGMDLGNVVQGSRRRETSEDYSSPPNKKRRSVDEQEGTSDVGDCPESHNDESEEEFEL
ncbi:unnamed protein product [Ectocarpus sp. 13 AM-2016]